MYKLILFIILTMNLAVCKETNSHSKIVSTALKYNSKLSKDHANTLARVIIRTSNEAKINPYMVTAIIVVESSFDTEAYNPTGDHSLAQINYKIWSKEFKRLGETALNKKKLILDEEYAIKIMVKILKILKKRHSKVDSEWYLRYHSGTPHLAQKYKKKLDRVLKTLTN